MTVLGHGLSGVDTVVLNGLKFDPLSVSDDRVEFTCKKTVLSDQNSIKLKAGGRLRTGPFVF